MLGHYIVFIQNNYKMDMLTFTTKIKRKEEKLMTNTNENSLQVVTGNGNQYVITKDVNGKYERKTVYSPLSTVKAETKEEKIFLVNLLNGDEEGSLQMKKHVGAVIDLVDVIFKPYDSLDEETGELTNGVLTYLFDESGKIYVTSSKSVYHTLYNVFNVFGKPREENYLGLELEIVEKKGLQYNYIDVKVVG
jgi:hypothetical protein